MSAETDTDNVCKGIDGAVESLIESSTLCAAIAEPEQFADEYCEEKHVEKRRPRIKHRANCKEKTINCIKITLVYMLSYVGLTCIVIGYSILGGFLFRALEEANEAKVEQKALDLREDLSEAINKDVFTSFTEYSESFQSKLSEDIQYEINTNIENFKKQFTTQLHNSQQQTINTTDFRNQNNQTINALNYISGMLDFIEEIFNIESKKFIANTSKSLHAKMQKTVSNSPYIFSLNESKVHVFQTDTYELVNIEGWNGVDPNSKEGAKWTYSGSLLYAVTVITTIGYGNITPKTTSGRAITILYALIGIPLTVLCITNIGRGMASFCRAVYGGTFCVDCRQQFFNSIKTRRFSMYTADEIELQKVGQGQDCDSNTEVVVHNKHAEIPIYISLILVTLYILFGAIMFQFWEDKWTHFESAYFCFITLSTIGFGDFVPGFTDKDWDNQVKQIACSLYLLIGLSTLAMCFDLMQQRGKEIANSSAKFIGLVKRSDKVDYSNV
ncbi:uncharacterized protein LOC132720878 [Ruditapes philippinarum]|uniref:uncharacterized protein LOC132720878 n=1 Tax=Ruditapes philippinarum TaxID=129788 RepID=UPI00295C1BE9|nr:uncharacterized protein LOC132720878 [Ruditapes philippinarum]